MKDMWLYVSFLSFVTTVMPSELKKDYQSYRDLPAVQKFREYIQIDTSKEDNIQYAVNFWQRQATELGLQARVLTPAAKPVCVISIPGREPTLPAIMLNSHMDVVPALEEEWTYPPYSAHMDENGNIYGRGTQDTKDIAIQYLEAIARLMRDNVTLLRTVHITLMPDEETGGVGGMQSLLQTNEFKAMNVGFALDEGMVSSNNELYATYVDRRPFKMEFTILGDSGHGYKMPDNTAAEKLQKFVNLIMKYREEQKKVMHAHSALEFGSYTTINVNMIHGGVAVNVIPGHFTVAVDMRLSVDCDVKELYDMIQSWMDQSGANITKYFRREEVSKATSVDDTNPYWVALKAAVNDMGYNVTPIVCPATSDMLAVRNLDIPAIGFAPKTNTISHLHGKDEYLNVETFVNGIDIYYNILLRIGNLPDTNYAEGTGSNVNVN